MATEDREFELVKAYSQGGPGTRETMEALGLDDFGDLIRLLARHDLPLPPPAESPSIRRDIERARTILFPQIADHADRPALRR